VAQFVFVNLPHAAQALLSGNSTSQSASTIPAGDSRVAFSAALVFIIFIALGYLVSNRVSPKPSGTAERVWGVIPAVISGYAILTYVTSTFGKTSPFIVNVTTPNQNLISSYLLVIFIVVMVAIVVALIAASSKKKEPPKPAGK
jgi:multisubunit Na+/H+ antiporter MnhB subunit